MVCCVECGDVFVYGVVGQVQVVYVDGGGEIGDLFGLGVDVVVGLLWFVVVVEVGQVEGDYMVVFGQWLGEVQLVVFVGVEVVDQ